MFSSLLLATCLLTTHAVELKTTPRPNEQAVNTASRQTVEDYIGSLADQIDLKNRPPPADTGSPLKKPYAVGVRWWHGESNQEPNLQEFASKRRKLRKSKSNQEYNQQVIQEEDQQAAPERPRLSIPTFNRKSSGYVSKQNGGYNVGPMWPCKTDADCDGVLTCQMFVHEGRIFHYCDWPRDMKASDSQNSLAVSSSDEETSTNESNLQMKGDQLTFDQVYGDQSQWMDGKAIEMKRPSQAGLMRTQSGKTKLKQLQRGVDKQKHPGQWSPRPQRNPLAGKRRGSLKRDDSKSNEDFGFSQVSEGAWNIFDRLKNTVGFGMCARHRCGEPTRTTSPKFGKPYGIVRTRGEKCVETYKGNGGTFVCTRDASRKIRRQENTPRAQMIRLVSTDSDSGLDTDSDDEVIVGKVESSCVCRNMNMKDKQA